MSKFLALEEAFVGTESGRDMRITKGTIYDGDSPEVKAVPGIFREIADDRADGDADLKARIVELEAELAKKTAPVAAKPAGK
jgi:hypothetical protein